MHTEETRSTDKKKRAQRRAEYLKANGPCRQCGSTENLQIDHVDPREKTSHKIWSWSLIRREAELKKCQILCIICHRKKTAQDFKEGKIIRYSGPPKPLVHGTLNTYWHKKCRCNLCKEVHRERRRENYLKYKT